MPSPSSPRLRDVLVDAITTIFVPIGWVTALFELADKLPREVIYALAAGLGIYVLVILRLRFKADRAKRRRILSYESLVRLLKLPPGSSDHAYTFQLLRRELFISPPNAKLVATDRGTNTSGRNQNQLHRIFTGDSPSEFEALGLEATIDAGQGHVVAAVNSTALEGGRMYLVTLSLPGAVIRQGEQLTCRWKYRWPGAVALDEDYWVFPVNIYQNQIGFLEIECFFQRPPKAVHLYCIADLEDEPVPLAGPVQEVLTDGTWTKYTASVAGPKLPHVLKWSL